MNQYLYHMEVYKYVFGAFPVIIAGLFIIEKYYRSLKIEDLHFLRLKKNSQKIIADRELRSIIRRRFKESKTWENFLDKKNHGEPIPMELRKDISFGLLVAECELNRRKRSEATRLYRTKEKINLVPFEEEPIIGI